VLVTRREFLGVTTASALAAPFAVIGQDATNALGAEEAKAATVPAEGSPQIRVLFHEADGKPLASERAHTLIARDLANDPLPQPSSIAEGRARIQLTAEPIQIAMRLNVPGFGEVYCYADNGGRGYSNTATVEFVAEAAKTRLRRARAISEVARKAGVPSEPAVESHLEQAATPLPGKASAEQIATAYKALAQGLHAGEKLAVALARHRISKLAKPRSAFLFGCLAAGGWQKGAQFEKAFKELFNFGVVSWYSWKPKPEANGQDIDYTRMDASVDWCLRNKIVPKGFGYVYLANGATPEWLRTWKYEQVPPEYKKVVTETTRRFSGRVPYVEVINEAHDKANIFGFSHEQVVELTREACKAARAGSPTVNRLLNHCCLWAEYARRPNPGGIRRWSPYRYFKDCVSGGAEFERNGLQLYYPQQDLLEIDRMLDRFKDFGKPLHITEISCNSAEGLDPTSMRPKNIVPGWHGPWTETMQADWLESIYTLCYSKPEFEAVGYWDLADIGGHFWPHGGLLKKDFSPKESYGRLLRLTKKWRV
jgi:endo-1,4-beta-xylanase